MPIYEYECNDCGHLLEAIQKMSDAALTDCPQCSKPALRKLVSAVAFRLKGKGWYETDFKEGDKKNLSSTDPADSTDKNSESKPDNSNAETKTEAKADAKKETSKEGGKEKTVKSESKTPKENAKITKNKPTSTKKKPDK